MTDELLRDLAKDLPYERPTAARRDALRSSLLVEATESTAARTVVAARRWPVVGAFVAGAFAAAAIAVLVIRRPAPAIERANLAQVTAGSPEVRIDHQIVATETGSDEIVRVREGTVALAIPAQRRGDRLVVQTSTAEVEGDAGELEVVVAHDQLQTVHVTSGTARVIVIGQAPVILAAGQTWRASVITAELTPTPPAAGPPAPLPAPTPPPPAPTSGSTTVAPRAIATPPGAPALPAPPRAAASPVPPRVPPTPARVEATPAPATPPVAAPPPPPPPPSIEDRFQHGWRLLRAGKAQQAADELGAAADAAPDAPLAADARYFQAVALVRANDPRAAERVLVQFLDRSPGSLRRGRAAVLLGRLIGERGDAAGARAWLETAASDPDPAIAAAAKAGLQALPKP